MQTNEITAGEARKLSEEAAKESKLLLGIFARIREEALKGRRHLNYYTYGIHLSSVELEKMRELGYAIRWDSPCQWYEIEW